MFCAEGLLENPALFSADAHQTDMMVLARQYMQKARRYPCHDKYVRFHLFKMLYRRYGFARTHTPLFDPVTDCSMVPHPLSHLHTPVL